MKLLGLLLLVAQCAAAEWQVSSNYLVDSSLTHASFVATRDDSTNWLSLENYVRQMAIKQDQAEFAPVLITSENRTNRWTNSLPEAQREIELTVVRRHWRLTSVDYRSVTNVVELGSAVVSSSARTLTNSADTTGTFVISNYVWQGRVNGKWMRTTNDIPGGAVWDFER